MNLGYECSNELIYIYYCIIGKQSCEHSRSLLKTQNPQKKALDVYLEFHFSFIIIAYCYDR